MQSTTLINNDHNIFQLGVISPKSLPYDDTNCYTMLGVKAI